MSAAAAACTRTAWKNFVVQGVFSRSRCFDQLLEIDLTFRRQCLDLTIQLTTLERGFGYHLRKLIFAQCLKTLR